MKNDVKTRIRQIRISDASDIKKYCFKVANLDEIKKDIAMDLKKIKSGSLGRFVLEIDKKVVGVISVKRRSSPVQQHLADIEGLVICEEHQGKGHGTSLIKECFSWAKKNKIERLLITVRNKTKAQRVYEHFGFKKYGQLKQGIKAPWEKRTFDEVFYYKDVK